jgi:hypothetical protein
VENHFLGGVVMMKRFLLLLGVLACAARADATTYTVCASACSFTAATWQTGINAAVDGDVFTLKATETFTGHWTFPDKNMATGITIRTDTVGNIPAAGVRVQPANAVLGMPTVQSDSTTEPAFRLLFGADHYTFLGIHFLQNPQGFGEIIRIGSNDCTAGACQEFAANQPDTVTVDRCYFDIDPVIGQKRAITLGATNVTIINNYFSKVAGLGQDSNAIGGANGAGPYRIENNHLESSTENILFGGDDPRIRTLMTVTGTPTTTSAAVSVAVGSITGATHNLSELAVGQLVAVLTTAGTMRRHTILRSITGSGTTGTITFDPIPEVPDVPGDIRGGVALSGVTIKRNHFTKPLAWQNPIIGQPASVTATSNTSGGTLAAGTYAYTVVAVNTAGYTGSTVVGAPTTVQATLAATGQVVLAWSAVSNASHYRANGRGVGTITRYFEVAAGTLTLTDSGGAGTAATAVPSRSYWQIKNLLEFKQASNVTVSGNVFENAWAGSDIGYSMWIKSVNQNGTCEWCQSRDIVVEQNIFRHIDGWLELSTVEYVTGNKADMPPPVTNLTLRNNLVYDSNVAWAMHGSGVSTAAYAMLISNYALPPGNCGSVNVQIVHNTIVHTSRGFLQFNGANHCGFVLRDNLGRRESNGVIGTGQAEGTGTIANYAPGYVFTKNAIAGINTANYPAGNFGPAVADWENEFVNYSATGADTVNGPANFALRSDSTYATSSTEGGPLGADLTAVLTATAGVTDGVAPTFLFAPIITTTSLPGGTVSTAYSTTLTASGTGALTWALTSGTLPAGLTLSSAGVISGTPSTAGAPTIAVTVTDAATSLTAAQSFTLTVVAVTTAVSIPTTTLPGASLGQAYTTTVASLNGVAPVVWSLTVGTLPAGLTLNETTGVISGTPTAVGTSAITVRVASAEGSIATRALSLAVTADTVPTGRLRSLNGMVEAATFLRPVAPTTLLRKGDLWIDTSGALPVLKIATSLSPVTWTPVIGGHSVLSAAHTDTAPDVLEAGDLLVANPDGVLTRLPGGVGCLSSNGVDVAYVPCGGGGASARTTNLTIHTRGQSSTAWAVPSALTEFNAGNGNRMPIDLTQYSQARFYVKVNANASAGSICRLEYSVDSAANQPTATFLPLDGTSGPTVAVDVNNGSMLSSWVTISSTAKTEAFIRVACFGGNGSTSAGFGNIVAQFK